MSLFVWNSYFNVGIQEIDDQHKILVNYLNELFEAMKTGEGFQKLEKIFNGLIDYTVTHFSLENEYMRKFAYPEMSVHMEEHQLFIEEIEKFQEDFKNKKISLSSDVMNYLKDWLQKHIMQTDKKLGIFLKGKV